MLIGMMGLGWDAFAAAPNTSGLVISAQSALEHFGTASNMSPPSAHNEQEHLARCAANPLPLSTC